MGYVESALLPGEMVKYRAKLHWDIYLTAITLLVAGLVPFVWGLFGLPGHRRIVGELAQ